MKHITLILVIALLSPCTWAWGRRGHSTTASLAAQLLSKNDPNGKFLSNHSYDLGYYANVPDFIWKAKPEIYKIEHSQHYMDLEIFEREFKKAKDSNPWNPNRQEFFKKYPKIPTKAGRSFWRIQELAQKLSEITARLKDKKLSRDEHRRQQGEWLLTAGILGHYVGDLSQPLHVSEDYDGRNAGQAGIHAWFEDKVVDEIYPHLDNEIFAAAQAKWPEFQKTNANKTPFELAQDLASESQKNIPELLKIDKTTKRAKVSLAAEKYKPMVIDRLTAGVLRLALIWSKNLNWPYDGDRFYNWYGEPTYMAPPEDFIIEKIRN